MFPRLTINLEKIRANTEALVRLAGDTAIIGVTKACLGSPEVAAAMIAGGVSGLADSRLQNLSRLKTTTTTPLTLLRQPQTGEIEAAASIADQILVTEVETARRLAAAPPTGRRPELLVMVEMGDGHDGVNEDELPDFLSRVAAAGIRVAGLAANVGCSFGSVPTAKQLLRLVALKPIAEAALGYKIRVMSGGNSGCLPLLISSEIPPEINQLRLGESILLGHDTVSYKTLPGLAGDAFILEAEVIEVRQKTIGGIEGDRVVLALGTQDVGTAPLYLIGPGQSKLRTWSKAPDANGVPTKRTLLCGVEEQTNAEVRERMCDYVTEPKRRITRQMGFSATLLDRSSDHIVIGAGLKPVPTSLGDRVKFIPSYFALLAAMTSPYIEKRFVGL